MAGTFSLSEPTIDPSKSSAPGARRANIPPGTGCTHSNGVRVPATVVTTAQEGLFHLEYYQDVVTKCS